MTSVSTERVDIPASGIVLKGILTRDTSLSNPNKLAVLLHPWSWLGGSMRDPVLACVAESLVEQGWTLIRYNTRGSGGSGGRGSFSGMSEGEDVVEVVKWGLHTVGDSVSRLLVGYSYGALIASLCPLIVNGVQVEHAFISYPLGVRGLLTFFKTAYYKSKILELVMNGRVFFVYGDRDEFTSLSSYETLLQELEAPDSGQIMGCLVEGANHFWAGDRMDEMLRELVVWLSRQKNLVEERGETSAA
ncbi:Alpha/Beta hydrolase protein [Flagelloscypha sp. PMI_526]|nr:Alpha/Beta hydrolase protein [Flagelloscypha sp. PMI_526]